MDFDKNPKYKEMLFSKSKIAFIVIIFWFLGVKEVLEVADMFNYYLYFLPLAMIGFYFFIGLSQIRNKIDKWTFLFLLLFVIFFIKDLLRLDYEGMLEQLAYFIGFAFIYDFSKAYPLGTYNLKFLTVFFFISSVIFAVFSPQQNLIFIPSQSHNFHVYIAAAHYSGKMYIFILLSLLYMSHENSFYKHRFRVVEKFIITVLLVLILATGARSAIHASIMVMFLFLLYRNKRLEWRSIIILLLFLLSIFIIPYLDLIITQDYFGTLLKMNGTDDTSSGRGWLQLHHLTLFRENWLLGVNAGAVDFKIGDMVNGVSAPAASESMYTKYLAREGLFGIIKIFIFLLFAIYAVLKQNLSAFLVSAVILVLNASISILHNSYAMFGILYMWLYFSIIGFKKYKE